MHMPTHTRTHAHTPTHTHTHTSTHTCTYTHTYLHTPKNTHTHIQLWIRPTGCQNKYWYSVHIVFVTATFIFFCYKWSNNVEACIFVCGLHSTLAAYW